VAPNQVCHGSPWHAGWRPYGTRIIPNDVSNSHPGLVAIAVVALGLPVAIWLTGWLSQFLARHDALAERQELNQIDASTGHYDDAADPLAVIAILADEEFGLIREVLDLRFSGEHVSQEKATELRRAHRRGLAARRRCGDRALDAELGWLQGYGAFALMADLSELDRAAFERDLDHRANELHRALERHRSNKS
jgi:hypothetical protein